MSERRPPLRVVGGTDHRATVRALRADVEALGHQGSARALFDSDVDLDRMWAWLAGSGGSESKVRLESVAFVYAAVEALGHELARQSLRGLQKGDTPWFSLPLMALHRARESARKADYLRVFIALLLQKRIDIERRGAQMAIATAARKMLGEDVSEKQVSVHCKEFDELRESYRELAMSPSPPAGVLQIFAYWTRE